MMMIAPKHVGATIFRERIIWAC